MGFVELLGVAEFCGEFAGALLLFGEVCAVFKEPLVNFFEGIADGDAGFDGFFAIIPCVFGELHGV